MPKSSPIADDDASHRVAVAVEAPAHSGLPGPLDYRAERPLAPGTLVRVPLGRREVAGVVWDAPANGQAWDGPPAGGAEGLRPVLEAFDTLPPLPAAWRELVGFAAGYYQRSIGELALAVLPPELRTLDGAGPSAVGAASAGSSRLRSRVSRRASPAPSSVRSSGGSTASASSPMLRW